MTDRNGGTIRALPTGPKPTAPRQSELIYAAQRLHSARGRTEPTAPRAPKPTAPNQADTALAWARQEQQRIDARQAPGAGRIADALAEFFAADAAATGEHVTPMSATAGEFSLGASLTQEGADLLAQWIHHAANARTTRDEINREAQADITRSALRLVPTGGER